MKINRKNIYKKQKRLSLMRQELEDNQLQGIKEILSQQCVEQICQSQDYNYRKRLITPLVTLLHMIGSAVSREKSFQSAWHNSGQIGGSDILCKARKRLPLRIWQGVDQWIDAEIEKEFGRQALWRGHRLVGIDGTCVSEERYARASRDFRQNSIQTWAKSFSDCRGCLWFYAQHL